VLELTTPLNEVKGIGPKRAIDLAASGLRIVEDLLFHLPFRYEDRSHFLPIAELLPGLRGTIRARVVNAVLRRTRTRGFSILETLVEDESGSIRVLFFNQPYLRTWLQAGRALILHGEVREGRSGRRGPVLESPQFELVGDDDRETIHTGRVVPIYPRLPGFSSRSARSLMHAVLGSLPQTLPDPLPPRLADSQGLPGRREAFAAAHFPPEETDPADLLALRTPAHRRLIFEEFFFLQLGFALARRDLEALRRPGGPLRVDDALRARMRSILPFRLTAAQRRALKEIAGDLMGPRPMNRLLQGDVGSGKTVVSLLAALLVVGNGGQVAFMAPTEILAEQHHRSFQRLLAGKGYRVALLTAGVQGAARRQVLKALAAGSLPIVVGTHAVIEDEVVFRSLRLVVIDEQHRFGVSQRKRLRAKAERPDVLVMTATPIPRTLALTLYGDLDLSVIDEMPPGRTPIKTVVRGEESRSKVYRFLRDQIAAGRQAYVVYPLVEESEKVALKAAVAMAERLRRDIFPDLGVGLLHGRMKADERGRAMSAFIAGRLPILVATTVIEVGIDVPNATVMVIEQAERFGLSQLHQLRGRVGRGGHESFCILMAGNEGTDEARRRLEVMCETNDGFVIARRDLEIRGPGEFLGTRQSGLPDLRIGDILRDHEIFEAARREAFATAERVADGARAPALTEHLARRWSGRLGMIEVG